MHLDLDLALLTYCALAKLHPPHLALGLIPRSQLISIRHRGAQIETPLRRPCLCIRSSRPLGSHHLATLHFIYNDVHSHQHDRQPVARRRRGGPVQAPQGPGELRSVGCRHLGVFWLTPPARMRLLPQVCLSAGYGLTAGARYDATARCGLATAHRRVSVLSSAQLTCRMHALHRDGAAVHLHQGRAAQGAAPRVSKLYANRV